MTIFLKLISLNFISNNITEILIFNCIIFTFSWIGISLSEDFIESFLFLEIVYLSLIIFCTIFSVLSNYFIFDIFLIIILFFSICDSILGLVIILITFNISKKTNLKSFNHLNG